MFYPECTLRSEKVHLRGTESSHKMTVLESFPLFLGSTIDRLHQITECWKDVIDPQCSQPSASTHTHTAHTSLVLGFSMFISTAEMQTTHTSICDHPRDTSKGNGNGRTFSTPCRCSSRESEAAQAQSECDAQHHISEQWEPQTSRLALMRHTPARLKASTPPCLVVTFGWKHPTV